MLTTLESNFVQEYKLNGGNATQAVIKAGYQAKYPTPLGSQLLKKPHIRKLIDTLEQRTNATLTQPIVRNPYLPAKILELPTKEEYIAKAWSRTDSTPNSKKEETQVKYTELVGKGLGYIGRDESKTEGDTINIICRELNLSLVSPEPNISQEPCDSVNSMQLKEVHDSTLELIEGDKHRVLTDAS